MADATDEDLMLRFKNGDLAAFDSLYTRHKAALYRFFRRQCPAEDAEELYQDTWLKIIRAKRRYAVRARFSTYLYRIAHNGLIDYYRRSHKGLLASYEMTEQSEQWAADETWQPEQRNLSDERLTRLLDALARLPAAQREAFVLREESGMSIAEIAETTGVNPETAKSRLRYAVAKLRAEMEPVAAE
jgi:RNA polymerase sigma-70 factor (ECF subfamily)